MREVLEERARRRHRQLRALVEAQRVVVRAVGAEAVRRFDEGEALKVLVLTIMGKDIVVEVSKDTSAD